MKAAKKGKRLKKKIDRNMEKSFSAARKAVERSDAGKEKRANRSLRKVDKKALKTAKLIDERRGASIVPVNQSARAISEMAIDQANAFKQSINTDWRKSKRTRR